MVRHGILSLILVFASGFRIAAQTPVPSTDISRQHVVPSTEPLKEREERGFPGLGAHAPFSLDTSSSSHVVEIRPESVISEQDKLLEANAESTIRERAAIQALDLSSGQWNYSQVACRSFPRHLFLRYNRNNGAGDESAFTVSIPRYGDGKTRFIPLLRRGYSLWSPTPVSAITVGAFNHILQEERSDLAPDTKPDWSSMAVCYAALAGTGGPDAESVELARPPMLHIAYSGEASVDFITGNRHMVLWTMVFDRKGILKKATRRRIGDEEARIVERTVLSNARNLGGMQNLPGNSIPPVVLATPRAVSPTFPK